METVYLMMLYNNLHYEPDAYVSDDRTKAFTNNLPKTKLKYNLIYFELGTKSIIRLIFHTWDYSFYTPQEVDFVDLEDNTGA